MYSLRTYEFKKFFRFKKGNSEIENESILLEENDDYDLNSRTEDDMKLIQEARQQLVEDYEEAGVLYFSEADKYMRSKNNYDISTRNLQTVKIQHLVFLIEEQ